MDDSRGHGLVGAEAANDGKCSPCVPVIPGPLGLLAKLPDKLLLVLPGRFPERGGGSPECS
eukprot:8416809-Lingulodinium_polyedra.AAC.1